MFSNGTPGVKLEAVLMPEPILNGTPNITFMRNTLQPGEWKQMAFLALYGIVAFALTYVMVECGYTWLAPRFMFTCVLAACWWGWIGDVKRGYMRPFDRRDKPLWFAIKKYALLVAFSLLTLALLWYWCQ